MTNERARTEAYRLSLARQIREAGVPIYIPADDGDAADPPSGLLVYQTGGLVDSLLFDFYGGTAVILHVVITINLPRFAIAQFELELPWKGRVSWLADPHEYSSTPSLYRLSPGGIAFPRDEVLNHRANVKCLFSRGESVTGCLLGTVDEPIPDEVKHGAMTPAFLIVYDQFWRPYRSGVSFWTDCFQRHDRRRSGIPRKGRLFDHPDKVSSDAQAAEVQSDRRF